MNKNRVLGGILFLLMAVFLIVGKLGFLGEINTFSIACSVFLVAIMLKSIFSRNFGGILFPIAFLCILYSEQLHIESLTPWTVLAVAALGTIGLSMLFGGKSYKSKNHYHDVIDVADNERIHYTTSFGDAAKYMNTDNFKQADLNCSFGSLSVYFENAKVPDGNATANLHVSFGNMELFIPKEWKVENHVDVFLGEIAEKNHPAPESNVTLHLTGSLSFGNIKIVYI